MTRFLSGLLGLALLGGPAAAAEISHSAAGHVFNPTWSGDGHGSPSRSTTMRAPTTSTWLR